MGSLLRRAFKSNDPAINTPRRNEDIAADIIYSDTPAVDDGSVAATVFVGLDSAVTDVQGIKHDKEFINTLEDLAIAMKSPNSNSQGSNSSTHLISSWHGLQIGKTMAHSASLPRNTSRR